MSKTKPSCRVLTLALLIFVSNSYAVSFMGTGTGNIPDGTGGTCGTAVMGGPLTISFAVSGVTSNISAVTVTFTGTHPWVGDVYATIAAPGGSPSADLFGNTRGAPPGSATNAGVGYQSNLNGVYSFGDSQTGNWWTTALNSGSGDIPAGGYRSTNRNVTTQTSLDTIFSGLTPTQTNGTWTLVFTDDCLDDTGTISAATLTLTTVPIVDSIFSHGFEG